MPFLYKPMSCEIPGKHTIEYSSNKFYYTHYSRTSIARTTMARTMAISNSFLSPYEFFPIDQENKYLGTFCHIDMKYIVVCWLYSLESPHRGDSNEYTQHTIIIWKVKNISLNYSPFASWPSARINPQWLELPISRTNFHGPKEVRAIKVWLYFHKMKVHTSQCVRAVCAGHIQSLQNLDAAVGILCIIMLKRLVYLYVLKFYIVGPILVTRHLRSRQRVSLKVQDDEVEF